MASIQGIYLALFGRPADPAGLAYWTEQTKGGTDLSKLISTMATLPEAIARFASMTPTQVVTSIYTAIFDRAPDPTGLAFFVGKLQSGELSITNIAINILDGAQGSDLTIINNRIQAANNFTATLDTPAEIAAYVGTAAADFGRTFIKTVTGDPSTIPSPQQVQNTINTGLPGYTPQGGQEPGGDDGPGPQPTSITVGSHFTQTFDGAITTDSAQHHLTWYTDRYAPGGFESDVVNGRTVLKQTISNDDGSNNRDPAFQSAFYDTQGRKIDVPIGTKVVTIELFIPSEWQNADGLRNAGFWATGIDGSNAAGSYPIIEFYNGAFRVYESDNNSWTVIGLPDGFTFDSWQELKMELNADGSTTYTVGNLTHTTAPSDAISLGNVILEGHNDADGRGYEILWDSLEAGPTLYITGNVDTTTYDNVTFTDNNVYIETGATLKYDTADAPGLMLFGTGSAHIVNASNVDYHSTALTLQLDGTTGDDTLIAGGQNDTVNAGDGNDVVIGGAGNDALNGGGGNDLIWGDRPNTTDQDPAVYGDDTINGGLGTNIIVLATQAEDIQLGGQDTISVVRGNQGDDLVFNFNFGPVDRYDSILSGGGTGVAADAAGADLTFDKVSISGYDMMSEFLANVTVKIGNDNSAYLAQVDTVLGANYAVNGNTISTNYGDIYTGPSSGNEFELIFEFADGGSLSFANALSRWEKAAFLTALGVAGHTSPSVGGVAEDAALNDLTYADGSEDDPTAGLVALTADQAQALIGILQANGNLSFDFVV